MFTPPIPLKSIYREVIDFHLKANFDNYVQAGWLPIAFQIVSPAEFTEFTESVRTKKIIPRYRVGWLHGGGEPPRPQIIDEVPPPRFQDFGPSAN